MTEVGELVAVVAEENKNVQLVSCDWKTCPETHEKKPSYPGNGTVSRNSSYSSDWVAEGLEPWEKYGPGTNSRATLKDYKKETPKAKYAVTASQLEYPEYHTQKHHLLSVNLFSNVSKLSHNAKLITYDVNHKNNGVCLPTYVIDIVQHDLQAHRGSHPNNLYNSKISPLLMNLENRCVEYCGIDVNGTIERQQMLMDDLNRLSRRVELQIKGWRWLLRSNAKAEREQSKAILKERRG